MCCREKNRMIFVSRCTCIITLVFISGSTTITPNIMTNFINNRDLDSHIIIIELQLRGVICTTRKNVYTLKHVQLQNIGLVMKCIPALNN